MRDDTHSARFVARVRRLCEPEQGSGRAARAILARSAGREPGGDPGAIRLLEPLLPPGLRPHERAVYYGVAQLYAIHPRNMREAARQRSLGGALGQLVDREGREQRIPVGLEQHLQRAVDRPSGEVWGPLRALIVLLERGQKGLDHRRLLSDLLAWDTGDKRVQAQWMREFYAADFEIPAPTNPLGGGPAASGIFGETGAETPAGG